MQSCSTPGNSPSTSPRPIARQSSCLSVSGELSVFAAGDESPSLPTSHWRSRLHAIKNSFLGSPRFHRRKIQVPSAELTPQSSSSELAKRSWFGALMGTDHEAHYFVIVKDKSTAQIKADLIHAFLCIQDLSHSIVSPTSFRAEYRRPSGSSVFSRNVKLQVDVAPVSKEDGEDSTQIHCLTFTLLSGPSRRFKRLCEYFQAILISPSRSHAAARRISSDLASNTSSSSSYNSFDGISPTPTDESFDKRVVMHSSQIITSGKRENSIGDP